MFAKHLFNSAQAASARLLGAHGFPGPERLVRQNRRQRCASRVTKCPLPPDTACTECKLNSSQSTYARSIRQNRSHRREVNGSTA